MSIIYFYNNRIRSFLWFSYFYSHQILFKTIANKFFTFLLVLSVIVGKAQINQPDLGWVFDDTSVSRIDIIIDQDSLDELLLEENWYSDHEYPASMIFTRNDLADTVALVGFRLRGNTSRESEKKSFKVAVNSFIPGQRYDGLKKINLHMNMSGL